MAVVSAVLVLLAAAAILIVLQATRLDGERVIAGVGARNTARYVTMADGTPIAVDVWLPSDYKAGERLPVILNATRYWRAEQIGWLRRVAFGLGLIDASPDTNPTIEFLNARRFVVVRIDARGTGASGGSRAAEWAPAEIRDIGEVAGWSSRQPWSNGRVGAMGVSYAGNSAEMLASLGVQSVRAVAPLFSDFDPQFGNSNPGGAFNTGFITGWGEANAALDRNDVCALAAVSSWLCFAVKWWTPGVKRVDADRSGRLLEGLLARRISNNVLNALKTVHYRDDAMKDAGGLRMRDISPYGRKTAIEASGVPMLVMIGWFDAATSDGALSRFMTFANPQEVYIGAWSHGGEHDTDPFERGDRPPVPSRKAQLEIVADFFDKYLRSDAPVTPDHSIRYFTMGARQWHRTEAWPPANVQPQLFYLAAGGTLVAQQPRVRSDARYEVDFEISSGPSTRWHTQSASADVRYARRASDLERRLVYTSDPLPVETEITGTPVVTLYMSSSSGDGLIVAHLEAVAPDGGIGYLTEGVLRLVHRRTGTDVPYVPLGVSRSFKRRDAAPLTPGTIAKVEIPLYATSVRVPRGYRVRLTLAGADKGLFDRLPAIGTPVWTIAQGAEQASSLVLPIARVSEDMAR